MEVSTAKWGNSLGVRVPAVIAQALKIQPGDHLDCKIDEDKMILYKKKTTKQLFEEFYGKPYQDITSKDIGDSEELFWGEETGGELL